jgi:predicted transcriptional regulator
MAEAKPTDPFISTEDEIEVDAETAAAIEKGIRAADEGRVLPSDEVRNLIPEWISKLSTPTRR